MMIGMTIKASTTTSTLIKLLLKVGKIKMRTVLKPSLSPKYPRMGPKMKARIGQRPPGNSG